MKLSFSFSITILISALLLFSVQPMFSKLLLPIWGGSSQIWNTSMVFYQFVLLAGYLYSHLLTKYTSLKVQLGVHIGLLLACSLTMLPLEATINNTDLSNQNEIYFDILSTLSKTIGPLFFLISATAPLLQKWFSFTNHKDAENPYFLYGASNLGSMIGLISYPLLIEPKLKLNEQLFYWSSGYILLLGSFFLLLYFISKTTQHTHKEIIKDKPNETIIKPTFKEKLKWIFLAFLPSSFLLGYTANLNHTIPATPLLWIIPLALYMAGFIFIFRKKPIISEPKARETIIYILICITLHAIYYNGKGLGTAEIISSLVSFFMCISICLIRLFKKKPHVNYLTEFYLWISVGGLLGGLFNSFVATKLFVEPIEYSLIYTIIIAITYSDTHLKKAKKIHIALLTLSCLALVLNYEYGTIYFIKILILTILLFSMVLLMEIKWLYTVLILFSIILQKQYNQENILTKGRNFFGSYKVIEKDSKHFLKHGNTYHGSQIQLNKYKDVPTSYYHEHSPVSNVFKHLQLQCNTPKETQKIAILGLGVGTTLAYGTNYQHFDLYEIDPDVIKIAENPDYFSYLNDTPASYNSIQGDARIELEKTDPTQLYDLIIADTFISDNIPTHLITKEAIELYIERLKKDGILAMHISLRKIDITPMLKKIIDPIEGATILVKKDSKLLYYKDDPVLKHTFYPSKYMIVVRNKDQENYFKSIGWYAPKTNALVKPWTDNYSNILYSLKFFSNTN